MNPNPELSCAPIDSRHGDDDLRRFVERYPRLLVLTGAGCSTASGLGDYRDRQGQWKRRQPITGQTFLGNTIARKRYWARSSVGWPGFRRARPGAAHQALVQLTQAGHVHRLVTQNVDELHQAAGQTDVIDLHGVLSSCSCVTCGNTEQRDAVQQRLLMDNPWLAELDASHAPDGDADLELDSVCSLCVPACASCGGVLKPDVVFFGENVPRERVDEAMQALAEADALLVVGSSLMVFSGFRFCRQAKALGKPIAILTDGITRADAMATLKLDGDCGERLLNLVHGFA